MCSKTYKLHMLWAFGKNKRIGITKPPVPKFLDTGLNVVCSWPWSQLVIEPIDKIWLNELGPTGNNLATPQDALLQATLPCFI